MSAADRILVCRECGKEFTFSSGEQAFYASRGLLNPPARCPDCRTSRKAESLTDNGYVAYGPAASFGGRTPRQMHPAICSKCGEFTEVPFSPHSDKPVYCSQCYEEISGPSDPGAEGR